MRDYLYSYRTTASLVRTFFEGFANGIADACNIDIKDMHQLKKAMLDHYEDISQSYTEVMFSILSVVNHTCPEEVETKIRQLERDESADVNNMFKIACNSPSLYEVMVEEYKRNFASLLQGRLSDRREYTERYIKSENKESRTATDEETTLRMLVRTAVHAYISGMKMVRTNSLTFRQASIISILITNTNLLVNDSPIDKKRAGTIKDIYEYILLACGTPEHCHVILSELENQMRHITESSNLKTADEPEN